MQRKPDKVVKNKRKPIKKIIFFIGLGIALIIPTFYLIYISLTAKITIPFSIFALVGGLIFECRKISKKWDIFLIVIVLAYLLSCLVFLPVIDIQNLEERVEIWPFVFTGSFIFIASVAYEKEATRKLTEGITLLQSFIIIYWVIDSGFINANYMAVKILLIIGLLFSLFSIFTAFSYIFLSKTIRLTLSIWSSIIMILLAVDNIYNIYQTKKIEDITYLSEGLYITLQYFLLGISVIYMIKNFIMLIGFLPGRNTLFNKKYFQELRELKQEHIESYSAEQTKRSDALLCALIVIPIFTINYYYKFFPKNFIIWMVVLLLPFILNIYYYIKRKAL